LKKITKSIIRKRIALIILLVGSALVYRYYNKKSEKHKVVFSHRLRKLEGKKNCFLWGEISKKGGKAIWNGEFKIINRRFVHSLDLLSGDYLASFEMKCGSLVLENITEFNALDEKIRISWKP
jgi:hypothetical protein